MSKPGIRHMAGRLLAQGLDPGVIAQQLNISGEKLLSCMDSPVTLSAYRQSIALREMQSYSLALEWLSRQMQSENAAIAVKAVHEVISHMAPSGEEAAQVELEEDA